MSNADKIKEWLKENKKSRQWLADKTFVTKRTVDNWLSEGRKIPAAKQLIIDRLLNPSDDAVKTISDFEAIAFVCSQDAKARAEQAAAILGKPLNEFALDAIMEISKRILNGEMPESDASDLYAAEDDAER